LIYVSNFNSNDISVIDLSTNLVTSTFPTGDCYGDLVFVCPEIAEPIPTMGEWGLINLTLLLGIFGVVAIRNKESTYGLIRST